MNKVFLIGRLTKDPEHRLTSTGIDITRFTLAVDRQKKDAGADFIRIVAFKKLAEICVNYLKKGKLVAIEGRLQINQSETKSGEKTSYTEVLAENMQMLSRNEK